jgi:hypothetical protein
MEGEIVRGMCRYEGRHTLSRSRHGDRACKSKSNKGCEGEDGELVEKECIGKKSTGDEQNNRIERKTEKRTFI